VDNLKEGAQWSLAFLLIGAGVAYALIALLRGTPQITVPDWLGLAIGTAMGYYFGQRTATAAVSSATNGMASVVQKLSETVHQPPAPEQGNG
jgi:hypothetical protein